MAGAKVSAGLLMYRRAAGGLEVLLVHPGGPFFARKDDGVWTIPKGEPSPGEAAEVCARREFAEETGLGIAETAELRALGTIQQRGGKLVHAWAFEGDCDLAQLTCNTFELEWPPRSGKRQTFPEVDRYAFFGIEAARTKMNPAQVALLDRLVEPFINA